MNRDFRALTYDKEKNKFSTFNKSWVEVIILTIASND